MNHQIKFKKYFVSYTRRMDTVAGTTWQYCAGRRRQLGTRLGRVVITDQFRDCSHKAGRIEPEPRATRPSDEGLAHSGKLCFRSSQEGLVTGLARFRLTNGGRLVLLLDLMAHQVAAEDIRAKTEI
jgi:hypothetical protein